MATAMKNVLYKILNVILFKLFKVSTEIQYDYGDFLIKHK